MISLIANEEFINGSSLEDQQPHLVKQQHEDHQELEELFQEEEEDRFGQLPDELVLTIFDKIIDAKSLVRCLSVSKRFASFVPHVDSVSLRLPRHHLAIRKGSSSSSSQTLRPVKLLKTLLNKFVAKPLRLLHHFVAAKSSRSNPRGNLLYHSPNEVLKGFKEIKSLQLEFPGYGAEVGLPNDETFLKWNSQFGNKLKSCTIIGATSIQRKTISRSNNSNEAKEHEEQGRVEPVLADEDLKLRIVWMVSSLIAASARHHLMKQVVSNFPALSNVVVTDGNKQGKLCMEEEELAELRTSLNSSMETGSSPESSSMERSMIPDLSMKLWYAPQLELPASGYVMKGATLIAIRPLEDGTVNRKGKDVGDHVLGSVAGFDCGDDEEHKAVIGEAVREMVKMKKTYVMEMTSFEPF
ncbi:hypothetical protein FNV43_RR04741 [Rhamnella rubrinervis]|uniref:F-box domain-containing protein n=1 Tax=Rhamnella rubrinervis TaxID=2594499 RepID=A0A8K0MQE0_9ROSA|nr:hypothetical protein FNV43_RR04741 [Rhamnella rubrinervis]